MASLQVMKKSLSIARIIRDPKAYVRKHRRFQRADIVVVSFPKAGRTWLRVLIGRVLSRKFNKEFTIELEGLADGQIPYIYMTHDNANSQKPLSADKREYRSKKVLFLVRDPRDVVVSYYHQRTKRVKSPVNMDQSSFIRSPIFGVNRIIGLMNIWAENRRIPRDFLLVKYEDLHRDPVGELGKIMEFVGIKDVAEELLKEAVDFGSFDNMRRMEESNSLQNKRLENKDLNDQEAYKVRRGKVGGYLNDLSPEDVEYLNNQIKDDLVKEYGYQ